jgi:hypothetical protein
MKKQKLDRLVPPGPHARKLFQKMHRAVNEAATQLELPLRQKSAPPPFRRLRKRGSQPWLGE